MIEYGPRTNRAETAARRLAAPLVIALSSGTLALVGCADQGAASLDAYEKKHIACETDTIRTMEAGNATLEAIEERIQNDCTYIASVAAGAPTSATVHKEGH